MTAELGLLDTSVLIDISDIPAAQLPEAAAISSVTLAELAAGPHATDALAERARRQQRLLWAQRTFAPIPFDAEAALAYGSVVAAVRALGRQPRRRMADLLIAATAMSRQVPLYTRNPTDLAGLEELLQVKPV